MRNIILGRTRDVSTKGNYQKMKNNLFVSMILQIDKLKEEKDF